MSKRVVSLALVLALVVGTTLAAAGCKPKEQVQDTGKTKVAVLFPGVVFDKSWNQQGYGGLVRARDELGCEIAYTENVKHDEQVEVFRNYAQQGFNIVIGHGGEYMDSALTVAAEYPKTEFVVTNGDRNAENVTSIRISYPHMAYMAGVLAGEMSKTKKVGIVLAEPIPLVQLGLKAYKMGVESTGRGVEVKDVATGDWADVNKARESALALIADGCDVLFHILDSADVGVLTAAQDRGVMAIGLYTDQKAIAPNAVIGSALGHPGNLIFKAASRELLNHQVNTIGAETPDTVRIDGYGDNVPQEVKDKITAAAKDLADSKIVITLEGQ